jgi:bifunctional non-homologous end joining protein LigD
LEDQHRELVVSDMKKELRKGKVLVDWSQNDQHKTTIAVYSLRAREHPTVSTPVRWEEVDHLLKKKDPSLLVFEAGQVLKRVEKMGDLFEPTLKLKQKLPKLTADVGASDSTSLRAGSARAASAARGNKPAAAETGLEIAAQSASEKKPAKRGSKKAAAGKKTRKI